MKPFVILFKFSKLSISWDYSKKNTFAHIFVNVAGISTSRLLILIRKLDIEYNTIVDAIVYREYVKFSIFLLEIDENSF